MKLHCDILTDTQIEVLKKIGLTGASEKFYLAGGTALALQIGHRKSIDFDWFTLDELTDPEQLVEDVKRKGLPLTQVRTQPNTVYASIDGVQNSWMHFNYPMLAPLVYSEEFQVYLADMKDIAAMKISAIESRGAKKDFIDIYALGMNGLSLYEAIACYNAKFRQNSPESVFRSLKFFEDADKYPSPETFNLPNWEELKRTISVWVNRIQNTSSR